MIQVFDLFPDPQKGVRIDHCLTGCEDKVLVKKGHNITILKTQTEKQSSPSQNHTVASSLP